MIVYTIDCSKIATEDAFWIAYLEATKPEGARYFGRNLDAFWDALGGGPGWPGDCKLRFINTAGIRNLREGQFYYSLQRIAVDSLHVHVLLE